MKQIPVDECPAGPWLDAAVAKALGHEVKGAFSDGVFFPAGCIKDGEWVSFDRNLGGGWWPSEDLAAGWELVAMLMEMRLPPVLFVPGSTLLFLPPKEGYSIVMTDNENRRMVAVWSAETAQLAFSRAFLIAKGIEFVEVPE